MQRIEGKGKWLGFRFCKRVTQTAVGILTLMLIIPLHPRAQGAPTELWIKAFDDVWKEAWEKVEEEAFAKVEHNSALPRVLLIGDSISMSQPTSAFVRGYQ